MRGTWTVAIVGLVAVLTGRTSFAQEIPPEKAEAIIREIQQSHIDGNVPPEPDFDRLLQRDLVAYFSSDESPSPDVAYEFLRDGPTQTGIAYPKFYAWVRVQREAGPTLEGAVLLAAVERQRFEVMQFVEQGEIRRDPSQLNQLFPPPVAAAIKARANGVSP